LTALALVVALRIARAYVVGAAQTALQTLGDGRDGPLTCGSEADELRALFEDGLVAPADVRLLARTPPCLVPRLDHAAPGAARFPRALCVVARLAVANGWHGEVDERCD
jgi:hypothetical protein